MDCVKIFAVIDIQDVITCVKFGDDRLRSLGLVRGQSSPFPIVMKRCSISIFVV